MPLLFRHKCALLLSTHFHTNYRQNYKLVYAHVCDSLNYSGGRVKAYLHCINRALLLACRPIIVVVVTIPSAPALIRIPLYDVLRLAVKCMCTVGEHAAITIMLPGCDCLNMHVDYIIS